MELSWLLSMVSRFQKIFDQHTKQEDIFEDIAKPVAER